MASLIGVFYKNSKKRDYKKVCCEFFVKKGFFN